MEPSEHEEKIRLVIETSSGEQTFTKIWTCPPRTVATDRSAP